MTTRYAVEITRSARADVAEIAAYLGEHASLRVAEAFLDDVLSCVDMLETLPYRGVTPLELEHLGIKDIRQLVVRRHRLIYEVIGQTVFVLLVADGRRDMKTLFEQRLLGR